MKYITLLLLLSSCCFAQGYDNTKVTAYRLINTYSGGPCTIKGYMEKEKRLGYYIQAVQSSDNNMAYNLLRLKKEAKDTWEKKPLLCENKNTQKEVAPNVFINIDNPDVTVIPNMYIVEVNRYKDTIYTTDKNLSLFFDDEESEYPDVKKQIDSVLTNDFKMFFARDMALEWSENKPDSLDYSKLLINGKSLYKHTRKGFEKNIHKFQLARTDSVFVPELNLRKEYWLNNIKVIFSPTGQIATLNAYNMENVFTEPIEFTIDGVKAGDPEELLYECFPNSTKFRNTGALLTNINNNYYYSVQLIGTEGYVLFYIKDNVIKEIEVTF